MKIYFLNKKLVILNFLASLRNYLALYNAGLRIGSWHDENKNHRYSRYRFFWKDELIRDIPDLVRVDDEWKLVNNGHVETIKKKEPHRFYTEEYQRLKEKMIKEDEG